MQERREIAARHDTDLLAIGDDLHAVARDALLQQFERDQLLRRPFFLLLEQGRAADKVALREVHGEGRARLERGGLLVNVVAIQQIADLQAQEVARPQSARLDAGRIAGLHECFPDRRRLVRRDVELVADLTGIAGP